MRATRPAPVDVMHINSNQINHITPACSAASGVLVLRPNVVRLRSNEGRRRFGPAALESAHPLLLEGVLVHPIVFESMRTLL
jgi:hypothetical protein